MPDGIAQYCGVWMPVHVVEMLLMSVHQCIALRSPTVVCSQREERVRAVEEAQVTLAQAKESAIRAIAAENEASEAALQDVAARKSVRHLLFIRLPSSLGMQQGTWEH